MNKQLIRILSLLAGLSGFGVIAAEILKKWRFIDPEANNLWVVGPILLLFLCNELLRAAYLRDPRHISPQTYRAFAKAIKILLIIGSLLVLLSIPFIWYGTIEELAKSAKRP